MSTRCGHIHATFGPEGREELHLCLLPVLAEMNASRFLACLEEAKKQTLAYASEQRKMKLTEVGTVQT
jgi:hypothetical protein